MVGEDHILDGLRVCGDGFVAVAGDDEAVKGRVLPNAGRYVSAGAA